MDTLLQMCAAQQGDSTLQLMNKQRQLLLLRKACHAWISKASSSMVQGSCVHGNAEHAPRLQLPHAKQHQRRQEHHNQREMLHHKHASLHGIQHLHAAVHELAANEVAAVSSLQQQQHCKPLLPQQQQEQQPEHQQEQQELQQQQKHQLHKVPSTKDVLAALFGSTTAGPAALAGTCALEKQQQAPTRKRRLPMPGHCQQLSHSMEPPSTSDRKKAEAQPHHQQLLQQQEQQQQEKQQQESMQLHVAKKHEHQQPVQGPGQLQQLSLQQQQQQLREQPQLQGRRRRHQPQLAQNSQQQQQLSCLQRQPQQDWQQQNHGLPTGLPPQQQQHLDVQSQAPRAATQGTSVPMTGARCSATGGDNLEAHMHKHSAAAVCKATTWLAPAPLGQQLFSPRTATHAPRFCEDSCTQGNDWQQQSADCHHAPQDGIAESQQQQQIGQYRMGEDVTPSQLPRMHARTPTDAALGAAPTADHVADRLHAAAAASSPELLQVNHSSAVQQLQHMELTPHQQQPDMPDVIAATPLPDCKGSITSPASKLPLGSVVAESPAAPGSAAGVGREGADVGMSFLVLDKEARRCRDSLPLYQEQQTSAAAAAAALVTSAGGVPAAGRQPEILAAEAAVKDNKPEQQQQQQPWKGHPDNVIYLGRKQQRHRVMSVDVGRPVEGILSCQQQCVVMLQHSTNNSSSNRFDLLQLHAQPTAGSLQGHQQQHLPHQASVVDVEVAFVSRAALIAPAGTAACSATAAAKLLPQEYLPCSSCDALPPGLQAQQQLLQPQQQAQQQLLQPQQQAQQQLLQPQQQAQQQLLQPQQQAQQQQLLAVATAFEVRGVNSNWELLPHAGVLQHAGAAAPSALDRRAHSESPAPVGYSGATPGAGAPAGARSLKALSHSTGRKKALAAAQVPSPAAATGVGAQQHCVSVYRLGPASSNSYSSGNDCSTTRLPQQMQQQQQQSGVMLVQSLPTRHAVTCLAVSEQAHCLAAAGAAGFACVWPLLAQHHQTKQGSCAAPSSEASSRQHQQALGGGCGAVADAAGVLVLPVASYRGISFPSISELCFILQPTAGCSDDCKHNQQEQQQQQQQQACEANSGRRDARSHRLYDPSFRLLLAGCSSQGSVAVWDVKLQQQLMAVHSPDLQLSGLLPVQPPPWQCQQQLQQGHQQQLATQALLLLALVASRDSTITPPAAQARIKSKVDDKGSGRSTVGSSSSIVQQQHLELRPVLLQQPGLLLPGKPILPSNCPPEQQGGSVVAAALAGTAAAAVSSGGSVRVWDILSGSTLMQANSAEGAAGVAAAVQVMALQDTQQTVPAAGANQMLVVVGTTGGVLTLALL